MRWNNAKPGFFQQVKSLPRTFYVANTMEIFERMAWYGMFTPLALYLTDPRTRGGLGLKEEDAGTIIGIVTFALYLMPVITGALGDRFGYKKMFLLAYAILTPSYYLLGTFTTYGWFLLGFMFVALGAAIFKPVVVGTVARVTNEQTSQLAFGIFYMMVNVGGFLGPAISGYLRSPDPVTGVSHWNRLFICSSIFIAVNFIWVILFYKEPTTESASATKRTVGSVLRDAMEVLGNVRFFLCVFGMLILFFAAGKGWMEWKYAGLSAAGWLVLNLLLDAVFRRGNPPPGGADARPWLLKPMQVSNWRFAVYLLILSGFWTAFNQILGGVPLVGYIRDFVADQALARLPGEGPRRTGPIGLGARHHRLRGGRRPVQPRVDFEPRPLVHCHFPDRGLVDGGEDGTLPRHDYGHRVGRHRHRRSRPLAAAGRWACSTLPVGLWCWPCSSSPSVR